MNIDNHNQRRDFLNLKMKAGLPLTPEEQAEYERLKSVRVVLTTNNVLIVERPPETAEAWAARINERNLAHRARHEREEAERNKVS